MNPLYVHSRPRLPPLPRLLELPRPRLTSLSPRFSLFSLFSELSFPRLFFFPPTVSQEVYLDRIELETKIKEEEASLYTSASHPSRSWGKNMYLYNIIPVILP